MCWYVLAALRSFARRHQHDLPGALGHPKVIAAVIVMVLGIRLGGVREDLVSLRGVGGRHHDGAAAKAAVSCSRSSWLSSRSTLRRTVRFSLRCGGAALATVSH